MTVRVLDLRAGDYRPHPLHGPDQVWSETNCYVDLWIEVLHALGYDPVAGLAFTLSGDFEDPQWTFLKPPPDDLRRLWGIEVAEANLWRPLIDVAEEHLGSGRLVTVEADSWYLPDTTGVSYRLQHVKTTIVPNMVDRAARRLGYFHGAGYHELEGDDFDGAIGWEGVGAASNLAPYLEVVRLAQRHDLAVDVAVGLARTHLGRRPATNPVTRLATHIQAALPWVVDQGLDAFHQWAFDTSRQCGANAGLAAAFADWLIDEDPGAPVGAGDRFREVAEGAKSLQFSLARAVRGRTVDLGVHLGPMETAWDDAISTLAARYPPPWGL